MAARKIKARSAAPKVARPKPRVLEWPFSRSVEDFMDTGADDFGDARDEAFESARESDWTKSELDANVMGMLPDEPSIQSRKREFRIVEHPDFVEFDSGNVSHAGAHFRGSVEVPGDLYWRVRVFMEQGEDIAHKTPEQALALKLQCCTDDDLRDGAVREVMDGCSDSFLSHAEKALDAYARGKDWPVAVRNYVHNYVAERLHGEDE